MLRPWQLHEQDGASLPHSSSPAATRLSLHPREPALHEMLKWKASEVQGACQRLMRAPSDLHWELLRWSPDR